MKRNCFPKEKSLKTLDKFADTSSASIPVALVHIFAGYEDVIAHFLFSGFGRGLFRSIVNCYINKKDIYPLVQTDDCFKDGYQVE